MITLNRNAPYSEVLGQTPDNCRYRQGKYRFTANGEVIGDSIQLEKEAKEEKVLALKVEMEKQQALIKNMNSELEKTENSGVITPVSEVTEPEPLTPGIHFKNEQPATPAVIPPAPVAAPVSTPTSDPLVPPSTPAVG